MIVTSNTGREYEVWPPDKDKEICLEVGCEQDTSCHDVYLSKENLEEILKLFEE